MNSDGAHPRRRRRHAGVTTVALALLLAPVAAAGLDFGLRGGVYTDESDGFLGAEVLARIGDTRWYFNPNVEVVFPDNGDLVTANADAHYDFVVGPPLSAWAGGGLALIFRDPDQPRQADSDSDIGVNLLAGVGFDLEAPVMPYIQGKIILADENEAAVAFGVRF